MFRFPYSSIKLLFPIFSLCVLLNGCTNNSLGGRFARINDNDPPWVVQFKRTLGQNWYKVKCYGVDVGRASRERKISRKNGTIVYQLIHKEQLLLQIHGTTNKINNTVIKTFSSSPPYPLLSYDLIEISGKNTRSLHISHKQSSNYEISFTVNGKSKHDTFLASSYSLEEELELEMWAASVTNDKDFKYITYFNDSRALSPKIEILKAHVKQIRQDTFEGKNNTVVSIGIEENNGRESPHDFDLTGKLYYMSKDGLLQYNIQETQPDLPTGKIDLYVHNIVPITQNIGRPERIKRLHLIVEGKSATLFESGAIQNVSPGNDDQHISLVVDTVENNNSLADLSTNVPDSNPRFNHRSKFNLPEIRQMAIDAVGDASNNSAKIDKLVKFVDEYISNEYIFESDIRQILKGKKGDCSEHARLFCALSNSIDIPCREATGLVYMGDWCKGFGLHAWNEVFHNGRWSAVDASVGSARIFPIYIQFPENPQRTVQILNAVHEMKIDIDKVELIEQH